MDMNKLTEKSQEAVQSAQSHAVERGHGEVDAEHLALSRGWRSRPPRWTR